MPSFDVVSSADKQEVDNAFNQCCKEIEQRFDFKGTETKVTFKDKEKDKTFEIEANSEDRVKAAYEILQDKFIKRKVSLKFLDAKPVAPAGGKKHRMTIALKQGLDKDLAKKIVLLIKDDKSLKVTTAIQGDSVRVTGKKKDDLQAAMAMLRTADLALPASFENFRD